MANKIKLLPQNLINKIAAGEVIERPASVVKELIENSIDAKATSITVEIEEGGIKSISIHDNGIGMDEENALESFKLHTTSKIKSVNDLDKIMTLGFRGEALASITAVSHTTIHTKGETTQSVKLIVENSKLESKEYTPRSQGTSIIIQDIFRHLPARKKFLKSPQTEYRHVLNEVVKYLIAFPQIEFSLIHNGKSIFKLSKKEDTKERLLDYFSNYTHDDLIEINVDYPSYKIEGYIIHPRKINTQRDNQYLFLNNRFIIERSLNKAIKDGYATSISHEKQPAYFINIIIDPTLIDINIHPRKLEAKISNINEMYKGLKNLVEKSIQNQVQKELKSKLAPFEAETQSYTKPQTQQSNFLPPSNTYAYKPKTNDDSFKLNDIVHKPLNKNSNFSIKESISFTQNLLDTNTSKIDRQMFQILNTYIVIDNGTDIQIIDQHAADERINFEKILKKIEEGEMIEQQNLLIPLSLNFNEHDMNLISENLEQIRKFGLDIDVFGTNAIKINGTPHFAREINYNDLISEILEALKNEDDKLEKLNEKIAASVACHGSIRAGRLLAKIEMEKIVDDLFKCKLPYSCPHGRPIIWTLKKSEIEKKFERIK